MFFTACIIAVLCSLSGSLAAPVACDDLVRPLNQVDLHNLVGRWIVIASSFQTEEAAAALKEKDSYSVVLDNSTYTLAFSEKGQCHYYLRNMSVEGPVVTSKVGNYTLTATLRHTSCADCLLMTYDVDSPSYKSKDVYLMSKRRELDQKEMEEFTAQLECLKMPELVVMDPTKEPCPEQPAA